MPGAKSVYIILAGGSHNTPPESGVLLYTSYLSILVHHKVRKFGTKEPELVKMGQNFVVSMLKSTPARKKYTTTGSGGFD